MNREELERHIMEAYSVEADYPWAKYPDYAVFRHSASQKWFAAVFHIAWKSLGQPKEGLLDVLNVKCGPILIGSFREEPGVYPAYHMNKAAWLSVALDGSARNETIRALLNISYGLTAPKHRRPKERERHDICTLCGSIQEEKHGGIDIHAEHWEGNGQEADRSRR